MGEYETDLVIWTDRQADLLRRMGAGERANDQMDWENVAEEIEALARSDRPALRNGERTMLVRLIKLQASPGDRAARGLDRNCYEQRGAIAEQLEDSPSLKPLLAPAITRELPEACGQAATVLAAHNEAPQAEPAAMTFTVDKVLGPWLPN